MTEKLSFLGIIPARAGSKGIPFKNVVSLAGKPLISYTIEAALKSLLDCVVVSTDCEKAKEICLNSGCQIINRPKTLAGDKVGTLTVLKHAYNHINRKFDYIVTLQPTSPLRTFEHVNEAINLISSNPFADSLVSTIEVPHNMVPESVMYMKEGFLYPYIKNGPKRRQEKKNYFARNGAAIYITKTDIINTGILGERIIPYPMNEEHSIDIDHYEDLIKVENILLNR